VFVEPDQLIANDSIPADVTIIGAGPAGIVMALELERIGFTVSLVESGGRTPLTRVQKLGDSDWLDPRRHAPMDLCTRRQVGGASVIWGGRCVPYDPVDFDDREYVPHSKWPVTYDELVPYFAKASCYCFTGSPEFSTHELRELEQKCITPKLADEEVLTSSLERWSLPTNFGKVYAKRLRRSQHIRVFFGLTCTRIKTNCTGDHVSEILAQTLGQTPIHFRSRFVVLACGGLDTTRLLLASNQLHPGGIGNHSDHLGRYLLHGSHLRQDCQSAICGRSPPNDIRLLPRSRRRLHSTTLFFLA
jgi:choline dehydrogenase-like flavoprotein